MKPFLWILFAGTMLLAQETQPTTPFKTTVNVVVAPTVVTDSSGNFINGLQPQEFRLYDNESLQNIKVEVSYIPISLVVAIQANAGAEPVLDKIKTIGPLIEGLIAGEQGEVAVLAFDHRLRVMQDFTNDGKKVTDAIKKINIYPYGECSDFGVTAAALAASLVASTVVRERFGYSFSTWRLHLRGEMIRSARDVGWTRTLTAGRMMRRDTDTLSADSSLAEFRRRYPLGSTSRVILVDGEGRYAGLVPTAAAYVGGQDEDRTVRELAENRSVHLSPDMNIEAVMNVFDTSESDELVVVDADGRVLGLLAEAHCARRYARELEKSQRDLFGES